MEDDKKKLLQNARPETRPKIPRKIRWNERLFGKQKRYEYLWNYYKRESEGRVPFYVPYIYMEECFRYLRKYGQLSKGQIGMVLIDDGDYRIDYFLNCFLEDFNYLTIVTQRQEYFENLQERAFQELGLLVELVYPWEEKILSGNLVWDFTEHMQKADCYPKESICFVPHKKGWKIKDLLEEGKDLTAVSVEGIGTGSGIVSAAFAESLLVPVGVSFRKTRCEELRMWCKMRKWTVKLRAQTLEKP